MTLLITEQDIRQLPLSVATAIPVMEEAFRLAGTGEAENQPRFRMPFRNGFMQFSPGALHGHGIAGFKLWANFGRGDGVHKNRSSASGYDCIYDMETGQLLAMVHTFTISRYRTSAVTAVAVKHLSRENAAMLGLYGCGRIAEGQLEAVCAVRPIKTVRAYSRTPERREAFCRQMTEKLGIEVVPAAAPEEVVQDADIIVTATTSEKPVLDGSWLQRPALIVAAGANHWYKREIDGEVVNRCQLVVVDEKEQAKVECGNLLWAISHGITTWDRVEELGYVVTGRVPLANLSNANILFCSHGLAITDVAIAAETYRLARKHGAGTEISL